MNLSGGEKNYKKWILIIGIPLLIVAVILYFIFKGNITGLEFSEPDKPNVQVDKSENSGTGGLTQSEGTLPEEQETENVQLKKTVVNKSGKLTGVVNKGTYAELKIGKGKKSETFRLVPRSIVFDSDKQKVILPSEIEEGYNVSLYATPESEMLDGSKEVSQVDLVVTGNEKVSYVSSTNVLKTKKGTYLVDSDSKVKYKLPSNPTIKNSFTGYYMNPSEIREGDGVFVYVGKQTSSDVHKKVDTTGTLLPKELQEKKLKVKSGSSIDSYKEKTLRRVIVYPTHR